MSIWGPTPLYITVSRGIRERKMMAFVYCSKRALYAALFRIARGGSDFTNLRGDWVRLMGGLHGKVQDVG